MTGWPHDLLRQIYSDPDTSRRTRRRIRAAIPPVEVSYKGCRMLIHPSDNNTEFQIWRLGRTHEERAIREILVRLAGAPFLAYDVGANAGSFTLRLVDAAPEGSLVRAFEPNPEMRRRLLHNLALNRPGPVEVHDCAISDAAGEVDLHLPDKGNLGEARVGTPFEGGRAVHVPALPLTNFASRDAGRRIDFLKVDIEGFEDRAILPLLEALPPREQPRLLFFEHKHSEHWRTDLVEAVLGHGYRIAGEYGRNALFEAPDATTPPSPEAETIGATQAP